MTLPCMSQDDHCRMAKPCKYKQGILFGQRDAAWVEQSGSVSNCCVVPRGGRTLTGRRAMTEAALEVIRTVRSLIQEAPYMSFTSENVAALLDSIEGALRSED